MKLYRSFTWEVSLKYDENNEGCLFSTANLLDNFLHKVVIWSLFPLHTFTPPLYITFDLNLLLLQKSDPGSAGLKFILSAWLIVTLNTAAAGGHQCCNRKKTEHCNFESCSSLIQTFKPVKIPLCYVTVHGRRWDNGHSFSAFRTNTDARFPFDSSLCC